MIKHFESKTSHHNEFTYPEIGSKVIHKVYGKVQILSVDKQELEATVRQIDGDPTLFFRIGLEDLESF